MEKAITAISDKVDELSLRPEVYISNIDANLRSLADDQKQILGKVSFGISPGHRDVPRSRSLHTYAVEARNLDPAHVRAMQAEACLLEVRELIADLRAPHSVPAGPADAYGRPAARELSIAAWAAAGALCGTAAAFVLLRPGGSRS